ncbi:Sodium-coupled monocarboxylate transporter 2, partial [Armadillidium nasatum]
STRLCQFISFFNLLKNTFISGISLFASTIALASMTNFSTLTNIILLGSICTLYSSIVKRSNLQISTWKKNEVSDRGEDDFFKSLEGSSTTPYNKEDLEGGIKAIIWTDVFQFILMVIGIGMVVAIGFYQNGGIIETLHTASIGGRLEMFEYVFNIKC